MKAKLAQTVLAYAKLYTGPIDGDFGPASLEAARKYYEFPEEWTPEQVMVGVIQVAGIRRGVSIGNIDGYWGQKTQAGYEELLKSEHMTDDVPDVSQNVTVKKTYNDWPKQDYASMVKFYGPVGQNQTQLTLPYPMVLDWDTKTTITKMTCHEKAKDSFEKIFKNTLDHYGMDAIKQLHLDRFGGCLNVRQMRGGSAWSIHCLPAGSPVWTPSGVIYIENLKLGDEVFSYDNGTLVKKKITNFWNNGYKKITTVHLNGGILKSSPEHKVAILKKEYFSDKKSQKPSNNWVEMVEVKYLKLDDKVICMKGEHMKTNDVIISPDFIYKPIKFIEHSDVSVPVFDIEVEDTHNFIVDGLVVSNSWGGACDLDPDRNQMKWGRDKAFFARPEYVPFWKIVEAEGGVSLGRSRNFDWMHFQFATL